MMVSGESMLHGGQFGHFHDMYINIFLQNMLHLILGFTFGVWA
jgi:hypothetical protein